ncbi:hypothetical protein BT96DRAFT_926311 [Gymnopus androsaceus JB14]|uniref:Uncharacterized protein n=1 Tax=Gymnopus androsaceus JB14 TaxID=1447944 RepID=A0A6A4GVR0_9AGAR|nr:hypothetical protein BT96DRAFT_926311 [Gymnopus androsaceus JB14]
MCERNEFQLYLSFVWVYADTDNILFVPSLPCIISSQLRLHVTATLPFSITLNLLYRC